MFKKILIGVVFLVLVGVAAFLYVWYKPHPTPDGAKHKYSLAADSLAKEFNANDTAATAKYVGKDKAVKVSGMISGVARNQDRGVVITLDAGDPMSEIQCTMADSTVKVNKGQNISFLGFCKGANMGAVILTDCVIK